MVSPAPQKIRPFKPAPFGRYRLLLPLSQGGMGEVFLGRLEGAQGFEKLCVIKRILPALASDPEFLKRFVNEAKTLVKLQHGAIAQVLDMGVHNSEPYLALEFVDGKDLRKLLGKTREQKKRIPMGVALYIVSRVLDALAYAHRKRDDNDKELQLVHRDISPPNIIVSYEGEVKVIDFGLAKSSMSPSRTNPTIVVGKFMYMAPEQAQNQLVDRRTDLYATGMCLYEMLSGEHPFESLRPTELMLRVATPLVAPISQIVPTVPQAVAALTMKAISPDPAKRFQTAEEFRLKVLSALLEVDPEAGPESASRYVRELFAAEYQAERRQLASVREEAPKAPANAPVTRPTATDTAIIAEFGPGNLDEDPMASTSPRLTAQTTEVRSDTGEMPAASLPHDTPEDGSVPAVEPTSVPVLTSLSADFISDKTEPALPMMTASGQSPSAAETQPHLTADPALFNPAHPEPATSPIAAVSMKDSMPSLPTSPFPQPKRNWLPWAAALGLLTLVASFIAYDIVRDRTPAPATRVATPIPSPPLQAPQAVTGESPPNAATEPAVVEAAPTKFVPRANEDRPDEAEMPAESPPPAKLSDAPPPPPRSPTVARPAPQAAPSPAKAAKPKGNAIDNEWKTLQRLVDQAKSIKSGSLGIVEYEIQAARRKRPTLKPEDEDEYLATLRKLQGELRKIIDGD